ncbi:MAG: MAPEG family protein [Pseudomonadota bacterium]
MPTKITLLYAVIIGIWLVILSFRVIILRGSPVAKLFGVSPVEHPEKILQRAIRGHANLTEYAPLFLILMLIAELNHASSVLLYLVGAIFTVGRLMHGILFCFMRQTNGVMRIGGMVLTLTAIIIALGITIFLLI